LYVGNLNYRTEQESLRSLFSQFGEVVSATILTDRDTGRSRGFGFVEMADQDAASAAIQGLNGTEFEGRMLKVNEARERSNRDDDRRY
jgi:RNA recognition motif-containing protein